MCCLCIQFTRENTSERTILHLVKKQDPLSKVWLLALQKRLATPLIDTDSCGFPARPIKLHTSFSFWDSRLAETHVSYLLILFML